MTTVLADEVEPASNFDEDLWAGYEDDYASDDSEPSNLAAPQASTPDADETSDRPPLFADVAAFLAGGLPEPVKPVLLHRTDGHCLFYAGKVNVLYGDPECGKTWIALAAMVEALAAGRRCVMIDLDHNGMAEIIGRLLTLGARPADLSNPELFRFAEPESEEDLIAQVASLRQWRPAVVVVDSLGELLPLLRLSSNSPDDYTSAHRRVLTPLAKAGAAVIAIDHMPKSEEARIHGQTGTFAKKRVINGATLRVTLARQFAPGRGGACYLAVEKDRPGGLRATCPVDNKKKQPAGTFVMTPMGDGVASWRVTTPKLDGDCEEEPAEFIAAKHLAGLADQLGLAVDAGRSAIRAAVMAKWPDQRHGNAVWEESARIRKAGK